MENYQRQNPAQLGLLPLTAYTKLLRVCRIAYEKNNNAHAWTHGRGVMRHGRRIKAGCVKSHNRHMQFVQTLSSVVHAERSESPGCAGFVQLATTVQFSYFLSFFCAVESISLIRFSWFTSEAPGS